jgi:hypothetical protein
MKSTIVNVTAAAPLFGAFAITGCCGGSAAAAKCWRAAGNRTGIRDLGPLGEEWPFFDGLATLEKSGSGLFNNPLRDSGPPCSGYAAATL